jgi:hypothetical protein
MPVFALAQFGRLARRRWLGEGCLIDQPGQENSRQPHRAEADKPFLVNLLTAH